MNRSRRDLMDYAFRGYRVIHTTAQEYIDVSVIGQEQSERIPTYVTEFWKVVDRYDRLVDELGEEDFKTLVWMSCICIEGDKKFEIMEMKDMKDRITKRLNK